MYTHGRSWLLPEPSLPDHPDTPAWPSTVQTMRGRVSRSVQGPDPSTQAPLGRQSGPTHASASVHPPCSSLDPPPHTHTVGIRTVRSVVAVASVLWNSVAPQDVSARQARSVVAVAAATWNSVARHSRCWMHCRSDVAVSRASWYCDSASHTEYGVHTVFAAVWHDCSRKVV